MKSLLLPLILLLVCPPAWAERVCSVYDGDTVRLCNGQTIRLFGIDAPELDQPYGQAAKWYLFQLVYNQDVRLKCNGWHGKRRICNGFLARNSIARLIVSAGYAYDYREYSKGRYRREESSARKKQIGIWSQPNGGIRPWDYRKGKTPASAHNQPYRTELHT